MNRRNIRFVYRERQKTFERAVGTFDLETFGLGGEYADGFTWEGPGTTPERHSTVESLFKALLNPDRGYTEKGNPSRRTFEWFAHNGAKYDFNYIANSLKEYAEQSGMTIETCPQGTKFISFIIKTEDGKIKINDSLPLLQGSLEKVSKAFAPEHAKAGHCPEHDFTAGGEYDPACIVCTNYARQDVTSLWHAYMNHRETFIGIFGVEPGLTTGSSAVRAWKASIPKGKVYYRQSPDKELWLRNFTTGAYITPGCTSRYLTPESGEQYAAVTADRTAAFAAAMKEGRYPTDTGAWVREYDPEAAFAFYEVWAEVPEGSQPLIPLVNEAGDKAWATGRGRAFIISEHWDWLLANGYKLEVIRGLTHDRVEDVFSEFIGRCERLEYPPDGHEQDETVKAIVKNMRNSLNGKLNARAEQDRLFIGHPADDDEEARPVIDEETGLPLDLFTKTEAVDAPYCQPAWYAITVMRQQIEDLRLVLLCEPGERFKCDTDSFTTTPARMRWLIEQGHLNLAPGYGNYKIEHLWLNHRSIGPKNYYGDEEKDKSVVKGWPGTDPSGNSGYVANCKGINRGLLLTDPAFIEAQHRAGDGIKTVVGWDSVRTVKEVLEKGYRIPAVRRERSPGVPETVSGWSYHRPTQAFSPKHFA